MKTTKKLFFVRHAQSIGNMMSHDERACCETPNHAYPLTPLGRKQAEITGQYLKSLASMRFDAFFHSTFVRTKETLEIVLRTLGRETVPTCDSRLDEKWDGIFHELSKAELQIRYPEQIRLRKRAGYYHFRAPGGESCPDVELRIRSFLQEYRTSDCEQALVVGHGRWILLAQKIIQKLSVEQFLESKEREACQNCSVTTFSLSNDSEMVLEAVTPWKGKLVEVKTELA